MPQACWIELLRGAGRWADAAAAPAATAAFVFFGLGLLGAGSRGHHSAARRGAAPEAQ